MKFLSCTNCRYRKQSITECFNTCGLPIDVLKCVENYFNNDDYPENLELDLSEIVESVDKYDY